MDLIKQYVKGEIDSVTAIYIAMHRESITPNGDAHLSSERSEHGATESGGVE